jgi:hypothetical protein
LGHYLESFSEGTSDGFFLSAGIVALLLLTGGLLVAPLVVNHLLENESPGMIAPIISSVVLLIFGTAMLWRRKRRSFLILLLVAAGFLSWYAHLSFTPSLNSHFSPRKIGEKITHYSQKGYQVATFRITRGILNFYANQNLLELKSKDLYEFLNSSQKRILILKTRDFRRRFQASASHHIIVLDRFFLNNETYHFISGKKD